MVLQKKQKKYIQLSNIFQFNKNRINTTSKVNIVIKHPIKYNLKLEKTYNIFYNENSLKNRASKT